MILILRILSVCEQHRGSAERTESSMIPEYEVENFNIFIDFFSASVVECLDSGNRVKKRSTKGRKNEIKPIEPFNADDEDKSADLSDFVQVSLHVIVDP
jgi:hypothetical protein